MFAVAGLASLGLTACGGGSGDDLSSVAEPQARSLALGESKPDADTQRPDIAADEGAAHQEPE